MLVFFGGIPFLYTRRKNQTVVFSPKHQPFYGTSVADVGLDGGRLSRTAELGLERLAFTENQNGVLGCPGS